MNRQSVHHVQNNTVHFHRNTDAALKDIKLQAALGKLESGLQARRRQSIPDDETFERWREQGRTIKHEAISHLADYLEQFEERVLASGGKVHWARDGKEANDIILSICQSVNAKTVTKGKSMATEEIGLNDYLEVEGLNVVETDMGEYILQLRNEYPSHIVVPAFHLDRKDIAETFYKGH